MGLQGHAVVILGVPRSGNSVLADCLAKLGVSQGGSEASGRIKELDVLNERIFSLLGISFHQPNILPDSWREVPGSDRFAPDVATILGSYFDGKDLFALNDPAITGLLPIYKDVLASSQPRYAICLRHPLSVAASGIEFETRAKAPSDLKNMEPPIGEHLVGLWVHYTLTALKETQGQVRQVVSYENLVSDPKKTLSEIASNLLPNEPPTSKIEEASALIDGNCCHHRHSAEELSGWPEIVSRTYDLACRSAQDTEGLNAGKFDAEIDTLWKELCLSEKMVQPIQLPAGQLIFSWRDGNQPGHFALKYSPTGSWQTLRCTVSAPPSSVIQIDPYQTPCQIWIRRAVWRVENEEKTAALQPGPNGFMENLGLLRLTVFGPGPLLTRTPAKPGEAEFEIELMVQSNPIVLSNVAGILRGGLEQARRAT